MSPSEQSHKVAGLPIPNSSASFWHSEPNTFLLNHHTTPDLPSSADIVIIGSGITGASAARFLAENPRTATKSIVLLEAREVCWGATGRNGGHCQPLLFDRSPEVAAFELRNVATVEDYILKHDVDCEWRKVTGCRTFWDPALFSAAEMEIEKLKGSNPEIGKLVECFRGDDGDSKESLRLHRIKGHVSGVTLTQGAGQLWPYKYVAFMIEKLVRDGKINLQTNTTVTGITSSPSTKSSAGKGRPQHKLQTPRGAITASHVILATNGYTSHLLPSFAPIIVPMRCEMSALHPPRGSERLPDSYGFVGCKGQSPNEDDYLVQRLFYDTPSGPRGGQLMFGGGRGAAMYSCVGEWEDDVVDPGEAEYLRKSLLEHLVLGGDAKKLKELKASHQWTGIKGYSRDNMPWVGQVPGQQNKGLWLCGGYTGHGMPNATLCSKALVDMVLNEEDGKDYEETCRRLVEANDLPESYVLTEERFRKAGELPSVAEQDREGLQGKHSEEFVKEAEAAKGRCSVM